MKNIIATAALSITAAVASTAAFADGHADPVEMTCAEFGALDIADQEIALSAIVAEVEEQMQDDVVVGEIAVLCNGFDDDTVASRLDTMTDS
ncbi:hypothetical protein [Yoonia sp. 208BN28-4]|uniref:hypothetical protein n=1 Tax=Yoonia sp. 208BN28-4 TaxID=3126505 RepID=UPI0030ABBA5C